MLRKENPDVATHNEALKCNCGMMQIGNILHERFNRPAGSAAIFHGVFDNKA